MGKIVEERPSVKTENFNEKFRVTRFEDFMGNSHPVNVLRKASSRVDGKVSPTLGHAYLLHGTGGTGKKTLAFLTAAALVCCGEGERPCGKCPACKKTFGSFGHPDILSFRKPEGKTQFPVELIREIRRQAYILPNESEKKIILIENAEDLNVSSANALLKVLEEPPEYLVFFLTCDNLSALPETIPSRCICLETHEIPLRRAETWLVRHFPEESPERLSNALLCGGGNLGMAIQYLSGGETEKCFGAALSLARALVSGKEYDLLKELSVFEGDRTHFSLLLRMLDRLMGQVARAVFLSDSILQTGGREIAALAARMSPEKAADIHFLTGEMVDALRANVSLPLILAVFSSRLKTIMEG